MRLFHLRRHRPNRLFAAALLAAILQGCGGDNPDTLVAQARHSLEAGDPQTAVIHLKNAIALDDRHAQARFELGKLYLHQGDAASAEKELRRAREAGQRADAVDPLLAQAVLLTGEFQRVLDEFPVPAENEASFVPMSVARANALLALNQIPAARQALERAGKLAPADAGIGLARARLALAENDPERALASVGEVLQTDSANRDAWLLQGYLLRVLHRHEAARKAYLSALEVDPGHVGARLALADLALGRNDLAEARKETDTVRKTAPNNLQARYVAALIDFREHKIEAARDQLAAVLKAAPDYGPALLLSGWVEYALGNFQTAETRLNQVIKSKNRSTPVLRLLAATQLRLGRPDEAARTLAPALREAARDPGVLTLAGEIALAKRDYAEAARHFETATTLAPNNAALRTQLGVARMGLNDPRATADLQAAAGMEGGSNRADTILLFDRLQRKQYAAALASVAALERKSGPSALNWNYRGIAQIGQGKSGLARESFTAALKLDPGFFPAASNLAALDLLDKKPEAARQRFAAILKARPGHFDALMALAGLALRTGDDKAYVDWLEKAANTHPGRIEPRIALARHLLARGDKDKALARAREALDAQPDSADALELLASIQLALSDVENALGSYRRLVERQPDNARARLGLASAQIAHKDDAEARSTLLDLLRAQPELGEARVLLIGLDTRGGRHDEALRHARQLQSQFPARALGYLLEGDIEFARSRFDAALAAYTRAGEREASTDASLRQSRALAAAGRGEAAEKPLSDRLARHPDDAVVRTVLADSLTRRGQYAAAAVQYRTLLRQRPDDPVLLNNLAWALLESGDANALAHAEHALRLRPNDPQILDTTGWILVRQGQATKALPHLRNALARAPDQPEIQYHLAVALARSGDPVRARGELERLLASGLAFAQEADARALLAKLKATP